MARAPDGLRAIDTKFARPIPPFTEAQPTTRLHDLVFVAFGSCRRDCTTPLGVLQRPSIDAHITSSTDCAALHPWLAIGMLSAILSLTHAKVANGCGCDSECPLAVAIAVGPCPNAVLVRFT